MKCMACGKETDNELCELCHIDWLQAQVEQSLSQYTEAVTELIKKQKEKENAEYK